MSQTQCNTVNGGVRYRTPMLTKSKLHLAHDAVRKGLVRAGGLGPLVDFLHDCGFAAHNRFDCVLVPGGTKTSTKVEVVPVWVILSPHGECQRQETLTLMDTMDLVSWLRSSRPEPPPVVSPQLGPELVPIPTTVGGEDNISPPSYVSQIGDVNTDFRSPLSLAEEEFRAVPRLDGGVRFDPDEYARRITLLNQQRAGASLPPVFGVTPSTYTR